MLRADASTVVVVVVVAGGTENLKASKASMSIAKAMEKTNERRTSLSGTLTGVSPPAVGAGSVGYVALGLVVGIALVLLFPEALGPPSSSSTVSLVAGLLVVAAVIAVAVVEVSVSSGSSPAVS